MIPKIKIEIPIGLWLLIQKQIDYGGLIPIDYEKDIAYIDGDDPSDKYYLDDNYNLQRKE